MELPKHIYIVGAGGVTSYFLPAFVKTTNKSENPPRIHVIDGDKLEDRNLDRQLFSDEDIGENKARALVRMHGKRYKNMVAEARYFTGGSRLIKGSLIFGFVDNHPARKEILHACDRFACVAILAANEYTDAQAMYYSTDMRGTAWDPRTRYPEILSDDRNDPLRPEGCTGEAAAAQLPIANLACASHALQLFQFYYMFADKLDEEDHFPIEHSNNFNRMLTRVEKDYASVRAA